MSPQTYGVYLTALTVSMLTPGPAMLQALTLGLRHGLRPVVAVACGNVLVSALQVTAALYGLSLLTAQPWLLHAVSLAGAAYLAWLGLVLWRAPARFDADGPGRQDACPSLAGLLAQGAFVALFNPKAWGFLMALLPPFAVDGMPDAAGVFVVAAPIVLLAFGGMLAYARFGSWLSGALASKRSREIFFRLAAATLWGCSVFVAG